MRKTILNTLTITLILSVTFLTGCKESKKSEEVASVSAEIETETVNEELPEEVIYPDEISADATYVAD